MLTNREIGERIGLAHSSVSRIRSGDRLPSLKVMRSIEEFLDWPIAAQARAYARGGAAYAAEFEKRVAAKEGLLAQAAGPRE